MTTKLEKTVVREVEINGAAFTVTLTPTGVRLAQKRMRRGVSLTWAALWRNEPPLRGTKASDG